MALYTKRLGVKINTVLLKTEYRTFNLRSLINIITPPAHLPPLPPLLWFMAPALASDKISRDTVIGLEYFHKVATRQRCLESRCANRNNCGFPFVCLSVSRLDPS